MLLQWCGRRLLLARRSSTALNQLHQPTRSIRKKHNHKDGPIGLGQTSLSGKKLSGPVIKEVEGVALPRGARDAQRNYPSLFKPFVFTVGVCGASFCGAAIWQYENMRRAAIERPYYFYMQKNRPQKSLFAELEEWYQGDREIQQDGQGRRKVGLLRSKLHRWYNSLSEGEKLFLPICFLNVLVFAALRVPALQPAMFRYFTCKPAISGPICWPMLLSAFAHYSPVHLFCNMYVLHSFMQPIVDFLGKEQFLGVYLSSAVISSFGSLAYKVAMRLPGNSLGASGAILTILAMFGTLVPEAPLQIIFLPAITFTAMTGIKAIMAFDSIGMLARWQFFDHACHLSGMLFGVLWCMWGHQKIWEKREGVMYWWHVVVRGGGKES